MDQLTLNADGSSREFVFRACYTDSFQGAVAGKFAALNLKDLRAFVLTDPNNGYTIGLAKSFENSFIQNGGKIVGRAEYSNKDNDFSVILAQIANAQPEIIFMGDAYTQVNTFVQQARTKGIAMPFIGGDGWDSPDLDRIALNGSYFTTHFSPDDQNPTVQAWLKNFQQKAQGTPDALAVLGYDATNMVLSAISQSGVDNTSQVAQTLAKGKWEGISGTIQFDQQHNPLKPVVVMQVNKTRDQYVTTVLP
jgi:branched-chain amino acid transport system substrate-binding protein